MTHVFGCGDKVAASIERNSQLILQLGDHTGQFAALRLPQVANTNALSFVDHVHPDTNLAETQHGIIFLIAIAN